MKHKLTLLSVFFTFFIDNLCWAIVFPIFAPYFLDPNDRLFTAGYSEETKTMIFGFFIMAFSLGQFLGAPIIGEYADRNGRKKAIQLAVFFTCIGLVVSAWSMQIDNLYLLFASRLFTGFFASSTTISLACISDLSDDEPTKVKNFGYLSLTGGISFVLGALLGGKLSDRTLSSSFAPSIPLWIAACLCLGNFLFTFFGFRETAKVDRTIKFDVWRAFKNIQVALQGEKLKGTYAIYFLFLFAWTILFQFLSVIFVDRYFFTNSNLGDLALYMGICWATGSGYINRLLAQKFNPIHTLEVCLIGFTILCGVIALPLKITPLLALVGLCVILGSIAWPICTNLISKQAPASLQGKILGMSQSTQSLATTLAPLVGALFVHIALSFPFLIASAASLMASILYFILKDR